MTRDQVLAEIEAAKRDGRRIDLRNANLRNADLRGANLIDANLADANLADANLRNADLRGANLMNANPWDADLTEARWGGLVVQGLPSHNALLVPTADGWSLSVGCWADHTTAELRELAARDDPDDWPEANTTEEIARRRPSLLALADLCDAHIAAHPNVIEGLREKWSK